MNAVTNLEMNLTGKRGVLRIYEIVCADDTQAADLLAKIQEFSTYPAKADGNTVTVTTNNAIRARVSDLLAAFTRNLAARINADKPARERVVVEAGKHAVGEMLDGHAITRLGKSWRTNETAQYGLGPWVDEVQYAYFD